MGVRLKPLKRLEGDQARAADPQVHAALSASAGTGKTHVLTARVLRLLLSGVFPEHLLCLTFTKAGAAEMANRVGERLALWVRLPDAALRKELFALGEQPTPPLMQRARQLFARVLDAAGGLRIQTIHSFAQTLLGAFPAEAGITPQFRPIEGREESQLARDTLAAMITAAELRRDHSLIDDVQQLSLRLGEKGAEAYLMQCARAPEAMRLFTVPGAAETWLRRQINLPEDSIEALLASHCADDSFDCDLLRAIADTNRRWGTIEGGRHVEVIDSWLAQDPAARVVQLEMLASVVFTKERTLRKAKAGQLKLCADYPEQCQRLADALAELLRLQRGASLVALLAAGLRAGAAFAEAYANAKRTSGVADFDDLIRWTRRLLEMPGMGEWVRYKLDSRTDHILVDEAQDTNADQWSIVGALTEEFFAGAGASDRTTRTLFMVGDFKQAIFGFQGTDPREFERMRQTVREKARDNIESAVAADSERLATEFRDLSIDASFRSAPAVLDVVDAAMREVGHVAMGLPEPPNRHIAHHHARPGRVELWKAFDAGAENGDEELGEEGWIAEPVRLYATALAKQVRRWVDEADVLATTGRSLTPGDILILVRSRGELASLIVARLYAEGVPVAGIDRLHLSSPLAVKDLIAAIGFAVQPLDDLNLANLLVSPLLGWNQDQLYDLAFGRRASLWQELGRRATEGGLFASTREQLGALLAIADFTTPFRFLENILSGPMQGRRKLLQRLGAAARDPIEELVSSVLEFERNETPSLDRFLSWFCRDEVEIKRDPATSGNAVRVMTVHGAKGLEAPVVVLADATADPDKVGGPNGIMSLPTADTGSLPLVRPRKQEMVEPYASICAELAQRELEEHWRLLYVGLTRASERLVIAGVKPVRSLPENCWHKRVESALIALGASWTDHSVWESALVYEGKGGESSPVRVKARTKPPPIVLPPWVDRPAPDEERPSRPLAPSQLVEDRESAPPPAPAQVEAARRGILLHGLFERLPAVEPASRRDSGLRWLAQTDGVAGESDRAALVDSVCAIISDPAFTDLFDDGSLAEVPLAAALPDGRVVVGTVDRLLVNNDRVRVIDFKTGRKVPADAAAIPKEHSVQMHAYAEALGVIFPGREIEALLLYTAGPKLVRVPVE